MGPPASSALTLGMTDMDKATKAKARILEAYIHGSPLNLGEFKPMRFKVQGQMNGFSIFITDLKDGYYQNHALCSFIFTRKRYKKLKRIHKNKKLPDGNVRLMPEDIWSDQMSTRAYPFIITPQEAATLIDFYQKFLS